MKSFKCSHCLSKNTIKTIFSTELANFGDTSDHTVECFVYGCKDCDKLFYVCKPKNKCKKNVYKA